MIRMLEWSGNAVQWNNLGLRRNPFLSEWDSELKTKSSQFVQPGEPNSQLVNELSYVCLSRLCPIGGLLIVGKVPSQRTLLPRAVQSGLYGHSA